MDINDLMAEIDADVGQPLRRDLVDWESSRSQSLHQKYRKILFYEKTELDRMRNGVKPLIRLKTEYYTGKASPEIYKEKPFDFRLRTIKSEIDLYLDSDSELIEAFNFISLQAEKVELIKDTLDDIRKRSFNLSTILNSQRFKHGLDNLGQMIEITDPAYEKD